MNREVAKIKTLGSTLLLMWKGGAVKIFPLILSIVAFFCFGFAFLFLHWVPFTILIPFAVFIIIVVWVLKFLTKLLPLRPELFQDNQTWLSHQRMLQGSKERGEYIPAPETEVLQPVIHRQLSTLKKGRGGDTK